MKNETKEILDELKRSVNEDDWFEIDEINGKRLLDYITNLQEELDRCVKANIILDDENAELQGEKL